MPHQSELTLEDNLMTQLQSLEYDLIQIADESDLIANLKTQLEIHNHITLSDKEFSLILNHLSKGNVFDKSKILRDKFALTRDDGSVKYISFLNQVHRCQNEYQVTRQISMEGSYKNRYDVTILINGLPLVQIELKRRGLELKEAFNQTNRYQRHSYDSSAGLFQYIQLFVISNGVNTKYYANNRNQSFKQTFYRADRENKKITQLDAFTKEFLEPCHLSKMITKYIVLNETYKILMVLRPYQYYATEAIVQRVKHSDQNGYIRHTTGSGKTLTSFKTAQILVDLPEVYKVVFVVDRKDLDYQTTKEFNSFAKGSIDGTEDTRQLVKQLSDDTKLIVTTIQKLNTAITKQHYLDKVEKIQHERIVFIFDECHRSQFGDVHKRVRSFFTNAQMFGFTGTPIFADNHNKGQTTADLFVECLHKYVITDAINDENVLRFSIEYVGKYTEKSGSRNDVDISVEDIDTKELMESPERLTKIADYIIANHSRKTHHKEFTAMMCVSSVDVLTKYYDIFQTKKNAGEHNLRIATIFSYGTNEDDKGANGLIAEDVLEVAGPVNQHSRDMLESYIADYNQMYGTNYTTKDSISFYNYYNDIAKRVKAREVDLLLVVNMFLTGFDSPSLNTLYVDKNLKYHGLIQAFSRTNRLLNEKKSQGNIVCFRNLKKATDEAITLFSNKEAIEKVIMEPYEVYHDKFQKAIQSLLEITPTIDSVDNLYGEEEKLAFVQAFREVIRLHNILEGFADYRFEGFAISSQEYEDFKSKYLDIYDSTKSGGKEKVSILEDVDFELELIQRDEITVTYILSLLAKLKGTTNITKKEALHQQIMQIIGGNRSLRSKRELIEEFINNYLATITETEDVEESFYTFLDEKKKLALNELIQEEKLIPSEVHKIIDHYIFSEKKPLRDDIVGALETKPTILQRTPIITRVTEKLMKFIEIFINDL
ncbi:Type-1 restriction enzyme R protein [candidate division SR1 bacterium Aalborg_AAW-1]|nr:Type-1 restriction enzyme R protein [candidate division SR1 bacterium Aalborg_AAW-1]